MYGGGEITLERYDTVLLCGKVLSIGDDSVRNKYILDSQHQQSLLKQCIDQLDDTEKSILVTKILETLPDEKQEKVFKNLYDEPSYQDLEKENYSLKTELEELRNSYDSKNEQYQNLKYGR